MTPEESRNAITNSIVGKPFAQCTPTELVGVLVIAEAEDILRSAYIDHLHDRIRLAHELGWSE